MTSDTLQNLAYATLGWLFGLLGQRALDWIRDLRTRSEVRKALAVELNDLRAQLAMVASKIQLRKGEHDVAFIRWLRPIMEKYRGFYARQDFLKTLTDLENLGDEKLAAIAKVEALKRGDSGLEVKKYYAPFLADRLSHLTLFSPAFQQRALEIQSRLGIMNQESEVAWFYLRKTFDAGLDAPNHAKLRSNAEMAYQHMGQMAKDLADMIGELLALKR